jgi:hypothetical protein
MTLDQGLYNYVVDRPCCSSRFQTSNNTKHDFSQTQPELIRIAEKHHLRFVVVDTFRMMINAWQTQQCKLMFYINFFQHFMPASKQN